MRAVKDAGSWARRPAWRLGGWRAWRRAVGIVLGVLAPLWLLVAGADLYAEWLWFEHLGQEAVLATRWGVQAPLFLGVAGLALATIWANVALAVRVVRRHADAGDERSTEAVWAFLARVNARLDEGRRVKGAHRMVVVFGAVLAAALGWWASGQWDVALRLVHGGSFGTVEPLFGRDVGFSVFVLPGLRVGLVVIAWLVAGVAASVVATYAVAMARELGLGPGRALRALPSRAWAHLGAIGACALGVAAAAHQVALADLVFSTRARVADVGVSGYADAVVRAPVHSALTAAALLTAGLLLVAGLRRRRRPALLAAIGYPLAVVAGLAYAELVQVLVVGPNAPDRERPYLGQFIAATRLAYGLDRVREEMVAPAEGPTALADLADAVALADLPVWDQFALRDALNGREAVSPAYVFRDVDVGTATIDGVRRLVMLAARELDAGSLPAPSWANAHLRSIHGDGVAIVLAAGVRGDGTPELLGRGLPRGEPTIRRPEIYFGEGPSSYAVVKTAAPESASATGAGAPSIAYDGRGIQIGGALARLALAVRLGDPDLLLSRAVGRESELLYRRSVGERVAVLAPFLRFDADPYLVIADGRPTWLVDAYATSADYPLADRRLFGVTEQRPSSVSRVVNYVRRGAVATVDAYDGAVQLYVIDPSDPITASYVRAYPTLFEPIERMPAAIRGQLRYPRQLFALQTEVLARFNGEDLDAFSRGDEIWQAAREKLEARVTTRPHDLLAQLPGEPGRERLLVQPLEPFSRANDRHSLAALLIGRSDPPNAGELILRRFPREPPVWGPYQAGLRVEQDPAIAEQLGLWQRSGLLVLRGNVLTLPIGPTPLYVEAVYLQRGVRAAVPELWRVIVAAEGRVAMAPTLAEAVARLAGDPTGR